MRKRILSLLVLSLAVLGAGAWWRAHRRPPPLAFQFRWPAGTRFLYDFDWRAHDRVALPVGGAASLAESETALAGTLTLSSYGFADGHWLLGLGLTPDREHKLGALGQELLGDAAKTGATFTGRQALLSLSATGELDSLYFNPGDPELWKSLVQTLAGELVVTLPAEASPDGAWTMQARDRLGVARVAYSVVGADRLERRRIAYDALVGFPELHEIAQSIDSRHQIALGAGHLASLSEIDRLRVTRAGKPAIDHDASLTVTLARTETFELAHRPELSALEARRPDDAVVTADAVHRLLEQRVDGLTMDQLIGDLLVRADGALRDDHRWFHRATGLLQLHPELCAQLVPVIADPKLHTTGRELILDLLAGAGNPEAQAVMRTVLATDLLARDADYGLMVQRFSMVTRPEPESLAFLRKTYDTARSAGSRELAYATSHALGAATGALAARNPDEAARYNRVLRDELQAARTPADREAALRSLGNAGLAENVEVVLAATSAEDADVRAAAAAALRKTATPETTHALVELAADPSVAVGSEALSALSGRPVDDAQLGQLGQAIDAGRLSPQNDGLLVTLLTPRLADGPAAIELMQRVLARTRDVELQARIRSLIDSDTPNP